jgi:hypothetical protein
VSCRNLFFLADLKGSLKNNFAFLGADPSRLAALLVGYILCSSMRPPRALPDGRLGAQMAFCAYLFSPYYQKI